MTGPRADLGIPAPEPAPPPAPRSSRLLGNRAFLVSTTSTVLFLAVIVAVVVLAPGFKAVRESFFSLHDMKRAFFGVPGEGLPPIWRSFLLNAEVFLIDEVLILILALALAVIRQIPGPAFLPFRLVAIVYVDLFRGIPLLLVIFMLGFGAPALGIAGVSNY